MNYPFKSNKYFTIYQAIIERAKHRQLDGYYEEHHYVPRSLGGTDAVKNLIKLTAREHYICHRILPRIVQDEHIHKMILALKLMMYHTKLRGNLSIERSKIRITASTYARFAQIASPYLKEAELINREKRLQAIQEYWASDLSKAEAEQRSIKMQAYWDTVDEATFQTRSIENNKNGSVEYVNLSDDAREKHRQQSQDASINFWADVTPEQRKELGKKSIEAKLKNGTDLSAVSRQAYANMSEESKLLRAEKIRQAKKEYWAKKRAEKQNSQLVVFD